MLDNLLTQRHELKFYIHRVEYEQLRLKLLKLLSCDAYQRDPEGYFIRSLYFDDLHDTAVNEKLAGIEKRSKLRLRIYSYDQDWAKLENKIKDNNYVRKVSQTITKQEALNLINGDYQFLLNYDNNYARALYFDFATIYRRPVTVIDYYRDAYMLDFNNIRVTFDKNLRSTTSNFDLFNPNLPTHPLQFDQVVIMEIKFDNFLPPWFLKIIHAERFTQSAVSKYCLARMQNNEYLLSATSQI
ncbi:polyphosphate polymerase domain-containing protein [candidate division WWE3 bacterium]|uniref:Polyphosphate polymerase domain-containing protein n=1 Tax=candidate division WWE3 bacterium TaxID=2053526 RepID=A0A955LKP6_UNCKA|nr:polyphosphate polymerase domain-containing protein [candidate division WWE3 bacterium]